MVNLQNWKIVDDLIVVVWGKSGFNVQRCCRVAFAGAVAFATAGTVVLVEELLAADEGVAAMLAAAAVAVAVAGTAATVVLDVALMAAPVITPTLWLLWWPLMFPCVSFRIPAARRNEVPLLARNAAAAVVVVVLRNDDGYVVSWKRCGCDTCAVSAAVLYRPIVLIRRYTSSKGPRSMKRILGLRNHSKDRAGVVCCFMVGTGDVHDASTQYIWILCPLLLAGACFDFCL